jgi:hypothetical protein
MSTVRQATHELLRTRGFTPVFGHPGSTEQTFLPDSPSDLTSVLGLQEASVVAMANGYAQATGRPALVSIHTAAGLGNAMGQVNEGGTRRMQYTAQRPATESGREPAMSVLRVNVLGPPEVFHDGGRLSFALRKAQALLLYLAVEGGMHPRAKGLFRSVPGPRCSQ